MDYHYFNYQYVIFVILFLPLVANSTKSIINWFWLFSNRLNYLHTIPFSLDQQMMYFIVTTVVLNLISQPITNKNICRYLVRKLTCTAMLLCLKQMIFIKAISILKTTKMDSILSFPGCSFAAKAIFLQFSSSL